MSVVLFLIYILVEAWIEMIFMKRLGSDSSMTPEEKTAAYRNFAIFAALWPVTVPFVLITISLYGGE